MEEDEVVTLATLRDLADGLCNAVDRESFESRVLTEVDEIIAERMIEIGITRVWHENTLYEIDEDGTIQSYECFAMDAIPLAGMDPKTLIYQLRGGDLPDGD